MRHQALTVIVIVAVACGFALAQPGPAAGAPAQGGKAQPPMAADRTPKMAQGPETPDLTPDQLDKIDALREAHLKEMLPLQTDLRVKEIELAALWRADEPDAKKIIAKMKEIGDVREKMEVARISHQFDIRKLLTPEQRKAMKKMGMPPGMGPDRRPGMGRGMRPMMRGQMGGCPMGGGCCGMPEGDDSGGPQGPMGQTGCPDSDLH